MPTKKIMLLSAMTTVGIMFSWSLARVWAARHSQSDGIDGLVASTIQVAA